MDPLNYIRDSATYIDITTDANSPMIQEVAPGGSMISTIGDPIMLDYTTYSNMPTATTFIEDSSDSARHSLDWDGAGQLYTVAMDANGTQLEAQKVDASGADIGSPIAVTGTLDSLNPNEAQSIDGEIQAATTDSLDIHGSETTYRMYDNGGGAADTLQLVRVNADGTDNGITITTTAQIGDLTDVPSSSITREISPATVDDLDYVDAATLYKVSIDGSLKAQQIDSAGNDVGDLIDITGCLLYTSDAADE